jgi:predicted DNA-binding transcriptional regulator AlpA
MSDTTLVPVKVKSARGEVINVEEAACRIGTSPSWIYEMRRKGLLPFRYLQPTPGKYFFDSADIDDYMESCWRNAGIKEEDQ